MNKKVRIFSYRFKSNVSCVILVFIDCCVVFGGLKNTGRQPVHEISCDVRKKTVFANMSIYRDVLVQIL